ncbi:site-specific DNA-methyltransferase [Burkholderia sp. 9779_493]|uniref:site-specific DNA-methyltransferase n=1 Tax=Burkholderia sp. 9779_493 TaxID=2751184 RepID=UPI001A342409|nr:site-specific DNA-methyltransferase [Burkholderia sp. 9779_493]MBG0867799.1 site-specific DNA-methyltransferase [Burkholderia sp. 9779_493]
MDKLKMHSPNLTEDNIARIRELFPGCVTEARGEDGSVKLAVDFDQLRQELSSSIVEGPQERYHLNWPGKREALLTANAPIAKTLRPVREESVNFDTTKNLFIEGDNLDALKLLQETYLGKVKMIYIDPPYNTGNDFIYEDDFVEGSEEYLKRSNQKDEKGNRLVANTSANGRFHSDWLSLIYPRIRLAKRLLAEDGFIFASIDDIEIDNMKKIYDEVFGRENFVGTFVWKSRVSEDTRAVTGLSTDHEYIVCYTNSNDASLRGSEKDLDKFKNPDDDPRGPWRSADMTGLATRDKRPNLHFDLIDPETGINYGCPPKGWRFEPVTMAKKIAEKRVLWPSSMEGRPRQKLFLNEMESVFKNISSVIQGISTGDGTREVNSLVGSGIFSFPKPTRLIEAFLEQITDKNSIVIDFFAGSASTAHAVLKRNAEDGGKRRFVMVQLPEPCAEDSEAAKAGYKTIAEVSKERIRRASKQISKSNPQSDTGFRVLKIDTSNMADVYYAPDALDKANLDLFVDNIKPGRTAEDLLFQVMLDWGVDLALPIEKKVIQGKDVFFVDGNALAACFDAHGGIDEAFVKELATHKPLRVVFRDAGFKDSAVKINVEQIFKLLSPSTEVKSI